MKKKVKSDAEIIKSIRNEWTINPVTRVHDNKLKKDKKKRRREEQKIIKECFDERNKLFMV